VRRFFLGLFESLSSHGGSGKSTMRGEDREGSLQRVERVGAVFKQSWRKVVEPNGVGRERNKVRQTVEEGNDSGAMMNMRSAMSSFDGRGSFHGEESDERYRPGVWLVLSSYMFSMMRMTTTGSSRLGGMLGYSGVKVH
jgi:hypothetical protein